MTDRISRLLVVGVVVFACGFAAAGYVYYDTERQSSRDMAQSELRTIAELRTGEISRWREERLKEARLLASGLVRFHLLSWTDGVGTDIQRTGLQATLEAFRTAQGFQNLIVARLDGSVLLAADPRLTVLDDPARRLFEQAMTARDAVFGDLFRCEECGQVVLDVSVPILDAQGRPIAGLIVRIDPASVLFPLIQSWPTPSPSAEMQLVRREGDDALLLNVRRHRNDPPLTVRFPLSGMDSSAVQAVLGRAGAFEGLDYRGVPVLAEIRPVERSAWTVVFSIDLAEILADAQAEGRLILAVVVLAILTMAALGRLVDRTRKQRLQRELLFAEQRLRESEAKYRVLLDESPDPIFSVETDGRHTYVNRAFTKGLGKSVEEVIGRTMGEIFPQGIAGRQFDAVNEAIRTGEVQTIESNLQHAGVDRYYLTTLTPLKEPDGTVRSVIGSSKEITSRKMSEEALFLSQEKFAAAFRSSPDFLLITSVADGRILEVNAAAIRLLGGRAEDIVGRTAADLDFWLEPAAREEYVGRIRREGRVKDFESRFRLQSGAIIDGTISGEIVRLQGGPVYLSVVRDITERKRAEEALRASERDYRTLVDNLTSGVVVHGPDTSVRFANAMAESLLGLTADQMRGKTSADPRWTFLREDGSPLPHAEYPVERIVASGIMFRSTVVGVKRPDLPEPVWLMCNGYPETDAQGRIAQIVVTFTDITEHKQAEEALRAGEQKFRALFENLAEGVALHELVTDDAGKVVDYRILAVNPAFARHTGIDAAGVAGRLGTELYEADPPPFLEEYKGVALGGAQFVFETWFAPLERHFRISVISPRHGQFATVFEDITDRKRREEELRQKTEEMARFTAMISHDLKSPLVTARIFLGYLERDLEQGKGERIAMDLGYIRDATGKMGRLLEALLEVSRVGRVVNPSVEMTLPDLLQESLKYVAGAISKRGVTVEVKAPPICLFGDRSRLEAVWQNLIENALKYMGDQPSPRIELGAETQGAETVFFVRDNGMGIDPRYHGKVFGLFEKLDPSSEGTGLGLALVRRILEVYEGRIWLESEGPGQGTCFRFTLPLALKSRRQGAQR